MNRSETISLLGFVPALVVQYLSEKKTNVVTLPDKQTFKYNIEYERLDRW
jgi:predicted transcriptional regulator